jgi:limonene-1,2-epoxide hydrolase
METAIRQFVDCYQSLNPQRLHLLADIYDSELLFIDPVQELHGVDNLLAYFEDLYQDIFECEFTIKSYQQNNDQGFVSWLMLFKHPRLAHGQRLQVDGCSELRFKNDRVIYQRDYYDMGQMIYEQLPLLGSAIKRIKNRMKKTSQEMEQA